MAFRTIRVFQKLDPGIALNTPARGMHITAIVMGKIAVIGAGAVGLSTAINIRQQLPSSDVDVIADKFIDDTTSYGAGGLFRPTGMHTPGVSMDLLKRWTRASWTYFSNLTLSDKAAETGNQLIPGYMFSNTELDEPLYNDYMYGFRKLNDKEMKELKKDHKYKHGYQMTTVITCCSKYMPWLTKTWLESGGTIISKTVTDLNELVGMYDVVVNCTALGSRTLINDDSVYPTRGHLLTVKADWIKIWMYTDDGAYVIPNGDIIKLGGIRQKGNYNLDRVEGDSEGIMERCLNLFPALKGCTVVDEWVGLRPSRTPLRVEPEILHLRNGTLKVVHNYGHGSNGISLSWGTAIHAAELVKDFISSSQPRL